MTTDRTKGRLKFVKMYDPKTGEYLDPLVELMTHEEAHGKKPECPFKFTMDKEAWDSLKIERDGDLTIKIDEEGANTINDIIIVSSHRHKWILYLTLLVLCLN